MLQTIIMKFLLRSCITRIVIVIAVGVIAIESACQAENQGQSFLQLVLLEESKEEELEHTAPPLASPAPESEANYLLFKVNYVYRSGGKGDFEKLTSGSVLHSGDHYKIIFTSTEECYVYIFQVDSANKIYRLFPMKSFGGVTVNNFNPVQARKTYYIPAEKKSFILDQQTGTEKIYFLSSRERDLQLEEQYEQYLEAQREKTDFEVQLDQLDHLLEYAMEVKGRGDLVFDPAETKTDTWEEAGQTFSVLQERLENMCDGCVYVLTFEHQ